MLSKDYLVCEYCQNKKSMKQIGIDNKVSSQTIMRLLHKYKIPINKRINAWNSGKTYLDDNRILAKEKHPRHKKTQYYNSDFKRLRKKILPCKCELCNNKAELIHHKDLNKMNNSINNLQPLCSSCHTSLHNRNRGITIFKSSCLQCKEEFIVYHNKNCKQKFCSLKCKSIYQYNNGGFLKSINESKKIQMKKLLDP